MPSPAALRAHNRADAVEESGDHCARFHRHEAERARSGMSVDQTTMSIRK